MKTVLQIVPRLVTGGVERGTVEVVAALVKAGWTALVASEGGPMVREIEMAGGQHVELPLASKNPFVMRSNVEQIKSLITTHRVDIVHARSRAPAWSGYFATRQTAAHFVTTFHNAYGATWWGKRCYNSVMAKGERVIAISRFVGDHAAEVYGVGEDRLRVIPRGVDISRFNPAAIDATRIDALKRSWDWREGVPVLMLPGRLTRWKGQFVLLEALAALERRDFQCFLVGSGDEAYRLELQNMITSRGLRDVVRIIGECRDMPAAYQLSRIVISASTRPEGFGRVITEAQAMGCLVIVTDHGGARETVTPGETGWRVVPDDPVALLAALKEALNMPQRERELMIARARKNIEEHFTTEQMTTKTLAVYRELVTS